ncbi:amino acid adenylation domain-containing protein, partial [Paenibacillus oenotherae]
ALSSIKQGLINNIVVFENYPVTKEIENAAADVSALSIIDANVAEQTNYSFNLTVIPGDEIVFECFYDSSIDQYWIEAIEAHLLQLVSTVIHNPNGIITDIQLLSDEEQLLLAAFNRTEAPYPKEKTIHSLFEEQVKRAPERTALVYGEERLSYAELNARSNRLARRLREQGVGPDELVGIAAERSTEMIVAILGVLKAGGAYVPIDPSYPEERIRYTLEDAEAKLVLTQTDLAEKFAGITESLLVLERGLLEEGDGSDLPEAAGAEHLAYVIYTSGSTGRPKGVLIEHRSLVNLSEWHRQFYRVTEADVAATYASFAFDASVWELFPYLIAGASVCIVPEEIRLEMKELTEFYRKHEITIAWLPPQMYEQLLEEEAPSKLRLLLTGADKVKGYKPVPYEVWNTYGPTESTVICTAYRIEGESGNIPIGKPLSNTRLYVMDDRLREQPIGVAGELCIAGAGLARGYLNRPELTEEKFVQHPNGERLYRTGDLARWLPDGNLDYLGRIDEQVKIRGYRIELGEIEAVLQRHEQVKEAVVIARQDKGADSYLCAYVVGHGKLEAAELRRYVGSQLPSYMVPAFFVELAEVPLTPNGKVDRRGLPEPERSAMGGESYVAPRTELEAKLAEIWQSVLGIAQVGAKDHFFELGGHSLKATMLAARVYKELNVNLPLRSIFEAPRLEELAERIAEQEESKYASIERTEERSYYPVSSAQRRMYILNQLEGAQT